MSAVDDPRTGAGGAIMSPAPPRSNYIQDRMNSPYRDPITGAPMDKEEYYQYARALWKGYKFGTATAGQGFEKFVIELTRMAGFKNEWKDLKDKPAQYILDYMIKGKKGPPTFYNMEPAPAE
jgi:hypothetical protein